MGLVIFTYHMPWDSWDSNPYEGLSWIIVDCGIPWFIWAILTWAYSYYHGFKEGDFEVPWDTDKPYWNFILSAFGKTIHTLIVSAIVGYLLWMFISFGNGLLKLVIDLTGLI